MAFPTHAPDLKVARLRPDPDVGLLERWLDVRDSLLQLVSDTVVYWTRDAASLRAKTERNLIADSDSSNTPTNISSQPSTTTSSDVPYIPSFAHQPIKKRSPSPLLGRQGIQKLYRRHPHIHETLHRESVKDKMKKELYNLERAQGYSADFATFKSFIEYRHRVEQLSGSSSTVLGKSRLPGSTSNSSVSPLSTAALEQALLRARDSLSGPGPPAPFIPTFEQLKVADKARDEAIEKRLRPPLPISLPPNEASEVQAILSNRGFTSKVGRESVSWKDIQRLKPGEWLNDEVINFYGQLIVNRAINLNTVKENHGKAPNLKVHYFNTFYWPKMQMGYANSNLKKWTKKVDIFSKDIVLLPINQGQTHWSAAVINFRRKRIEAYDSMDAQNKRYPEFFEHIRDYLQGEHRDKKGRDFDFTGWQNFTRSDTPLQENFFDCGVFTTQFLESAARGEEGFSFSQRDTKYLRTQMILEIGRARLYNDPNPK